MKNSNNKEFRRKRRVWIVFILLGLTVIPFTMNYLILSEQYWEVIGGPKEWLAFWPSYLSALASAVMIAYTAMTLKNNKRQLDELKRQWDADHTPNISVSFNFIPPYAYLRFENTSIVEVKDFSLRIEFYEGNELIKDFVPKDRQEIMDNFQTIIEPKGTRNLIIRNDLCGLSNHETILLYLKYNGEEKEPIKIICNDMFTIGDYSMWYLTQNK